MDNLNIFLLFPQTDDEILAFDEEKLYQEIPKQLQAVKDVSNNYTLFYNPKNIKLFCDELGELHGGKYLDNVRNQILNILGKKCKDISKWISYKSDCCYYKWKIDSNPLVEMESNKIFLSAVEKFVDDKPGNTVIISLLNNDTWERDIMPIIKDAKHYKDLPILCNIPYFSTVNTFIEWYNTEKRNITFSLEDVYRFSRTNKIYPDSKQRIYLEKETGRYWYKDYFHKDNKEHYEVFDKEGNHLGEADVNGNLDESKCDKTKSIKNLLN